MKRKKSLENGLEIVIERISRHISFTTSKTGSLVFGMLKIGAKVFVR